MCTRTRPTSQDVQPILLTLRRTTGSAIEGRPWCVVRIALNATIRYSPCRPSFPFGQPSAAALR
jgi:hypothetical protein